MSRSGVPGANLCDTWHNGNSAGNKSLVTYRMGVGVPGYTGFTPAEECIQIPIKAGCMERAPLESLVAGRLGGHGGAMIVNDLSTHKADYSMTPAQFAAATAPNELWDPAAKKGIGDPPFIKRPESQGVRPFLGSSTFRDTFTGGVSGRPLPANVTALGQLRPATALNAVADDKPCNPFYVTEYSQKSSQVMHGTAPKFGGRGPPPAARPRSNVGLEPAKLRREFISTCYRADFGSFGQNPASRMPADPADFSKQATTAEHFLGTTKGTHHPPGYTGFIPATTRNPTAVQQVGFYRSIYTVSQLHRLIIHRCTPQLHSQLRRAPYEALP